MRWQWLRGLRYPSVCECEAFFATQGIASHNDRRDDGRILEETKHPENYEYECPYILCDWLINYEANLIERELFQIEVIVKDEKNTYALLQIIKNHYKINEDVILKIYEYIVFDSDRYDIMI